MILILTQDYCPKCENLKKFLELGLKGKYNDQIEFVHRQTESDRFDELVRKFEIQATPAIIKGEDVLRDTNPSKVMSFLAG
ncbi:MAG TPA: glutaredoxin [Erysipelothrix sp.]|nr:glutaredoxin [Erysipelothrix sp.]